MKIKKLSALLVLTTLFSVMVAAVYPGVTKKDMAKYQSKSNQQVSAQASTDEKENSTDNKEQGSKEKKEGHQAQGKSTEPNKNPSKRIELSEKDMLLLARTVNGEARGEPFEGQVAVAAVVLNRVESPDFPKTVAGVVFEPGAFDAVKDGQIWLEPTEQSIKAAYSAARGVDNTGRALYYFNPDKATSKWIWTRPIVTKIGQHLFAH